MEVSNGKTYKKITWLNKTLLFFTTFAIATFLLLSYTGRGPLQVADRIPVPEKYRCQVEKVIVPVDKDGDGIWDLDDIVMGARLDMKNKPIYKDAYYAGGYPPDNEGVCTDVVWRALANAGYNLKEMMDEDIRRNPGLYPRVGGRPEPNIDFRRVPNQEAFFKRHAEILTTEIIPWDPENLRQWQGGDIVVYGPRLEHVGIVSDKRRADGVPLLIHNAGPYTREDDSLLSWPSPMRYHFRFPKSS